MQKTMDTPLLNEIAFDLVKDKVIEDQMKEYKMTEEQQEKITKNDVKKSNNGNDEEEDDEEFGEIDSEEERIMNKQINQRLEQQEKKIEAEKARLARKYGEIIDIVETEFLDTMIKNEKVVCHFYHDQFERCKIMDKHFREMANLHPETLFVKINDNCFSCFSIEIESTVSYFSNSLTHKSNLSCKESIISFLFFGNLI